jgi:hypothetical protein
MNALLLGIIGEYIGRIYKNVKQMPMAIIEASIDRLAPTDMDLAPNETSVRLVGTDAH